LLQSETALAKIPKFSLVSKAILFDNYKDLRCSLMTIYAKSVTRRSLDKPRRKVWET